MPGTEPGMTAMNLLPTILRRLQPSLRRGHALLPCSYLVVVLHRKPDIIETFKEAHAVGSRNVEREVGSAGSADGLRLQIDSERRRPVHRDHARLETLRILCPQHHRQQTVLQAILAIDIGEAARHNAA